MRAIRQPGRSSVIFVGRGLVGGGWLVRYFTIFMAKAGSLPSHGGLFTGLGNANLKSGFSLRHPRRAKTRVAEYFNSWAYMPTWLAYLLPAAWAILLIIHVVAVGA